MHTHHFNGHFQGEAELTGESTATSITNQLLSADDDAVPIINLLLLKFNIYLITF